MKTPYSKPDAQTPPATSNKWLTSLAQPRRIEAHGSIAARFIYSLRLIALYERAGHDPVAELAVRLGSVASASASLALAQAITRIWPENIHVSRFCCCALTHDEAALASSVDCAAKGQRDAFEAELSGLIRHDRIGRLWEHSIALVAAESHG